MFSNESLGLDGGTQIVDHRAGSPLYLGRLDGLSLKGKTHLFQPHSKRVFWIVLNVLLIVVLLLLYWRRRVWQSRKLKATDLA